jgi:leader peptidase (prepilin peptidase)/N-methyltransferase
MVIILLTVLGLCLGSFVNALVWRVHEQAKQGAGQRAGGDKGKEDLSILRGRSMCPNCHHGLAAKDLVPVLSWLSLRGKCRYCGASISWQYPLVELLTTSLFIFSYSFWPLVFNDKGTTLFVFWLIFLVGLIALAVYDLRWYLLPNKIMYPLFVLAALQVIVATLIFHGNFEQLRSAIFGLAIGGGIFYAIFQISGGKWIGGGDVKLGALLGLVIGGPTSSLLLIFLASGLGSLAAIPILLTGKAGRSTRIPFGPFLIMAVIVTYLFGASLIGWYKQQALGL